MSSVDSLSPQTMQEFIGQEKIKTNLEIFMEAALSRHEPLDHVLLFGPFGLGKSTLANIIANDMFAKMHVVSGIGNMSATELVEILKSLKEGDVLLIKDIDNLPKDVEKELYSVMEDYQLDTKFINGTGTKNRCFHCRDLH